MKTYHKLYETYEIPKDLQNIINDYINDLMITDKMNKSINIIKNKVNPVYHSIILNNQYTLSVGFNVENKILNIVSYSLYMIENNGIQFVPEEYLNKW